MRLLDYCDLGDAPELRVQRVGSVDMVSRNIVRITHVVRVPGKDDWVAVSHHIWDVADLMQCLGVAQLIAAMLQGAGCAELAEVGGALRH